MLLLKPDEIPNPTRMVLDKIDPPVIVILGGTAAVAQGVEDELNRSYPIWAAE